MLAKELVTHWNRTACIKKPSVTAQGWLKKTDYRRDTQNRLLRRMKPGTKSLKEIRFYQQCQIFLIAVSPFQCLVCEVCLSLDGGGDLRWQSMALFALQCSTEAYMAGFWHDANLCALHQKVVTVNRKDVWLGTKICGRVHVGGPSQVSDVGNVNVTFKNIHLADPSEKKGVKRSLIKDHFAVEEDWCAKFREKAAMDTSAAVGHAKGKGNGKGKGKEGPKWLRSVLNDALHNISHPSICHLVRRGGVKHISANIYEVVRGILKIFLECVIRDVITYCLYSERKTMTTIDVIFTLKHHGRNLYGFTH